jgi:beta-phosphoglucomutase
MNKRNLEAVIFDLDGVIADTNHLYFRANQMIAEDLGIPFTYEESDQFKGIGRMEIVRSLVEKSGKPHSLDHMVKLAEQKNTYYQGLIQDMDERSILPGIKQFIHSLRENGIKTAIASSSTNGTTVLKKIGLYEQFDCIIDPSTLKKGKPDPEIFIKAADRLQVPYQNCAAIEDGEAGMKAILATDMFSIGVGNSVNMFPSAWHIDSTDELSYEELVLRMGE